MLKALLLILVLFSSITFAQSEEKRISRIIDTFGVLGECDLGNRLESLRRELNDDPNVRATIFTYQSIDSLPDDFKRISLINGIKKQFRFLMIDESRVDFIQAGFEQKQRAELWIVPLGAEKPTPSDSLPHPVIPTDKTLLYGRRYLYSNYSDSESVYQFPFEYLSVSAKKEKLKWEKENKKNGIDFWSEEDNYPEDKKGEKKYQWLSEGFGEVLKTQTNSTGLLVFYADSKFFDIKVIQRVIEEGKRRISKENNISESKINILYGGHRDFLNVDYWIIPKDGELPKPTQDSYIFDEFGKLSEKKWKLRLDKYKEKILCGSEESYYLKVFAPEEEIANEIGKKYLDHIVKLRCIDPPKIIVVYGGEDFYTEKNEKIKTELWVVPFGGKPPIDDN